MENLNIKDIINIITKLNIRTGALAIELHKGQTYGDKPYMYHINNVAQKVVFLYGKEKPTDDDELELLLLLIIALLHDSIEDTTATTESLLDFGIPEALVHSIDCVTKREGESLNAYYKRVVSDDRAFKIKIADTLTNLEHSLQSNVQRRINKYVNQLEQLYKLRGDDGYTEE